MSKSLMLLFLRNSHDFGCEPACTHSYKIFSSHQCYLGWALKNGTVLKEKNRVYSKKRLIKLL